MIYLVNQFQRVEGREYNIWRYHTAGDVIRTWNVFTWIDALDDSLESKFARAALLDNKVPYHYNPHLFAEIRAKKGKVPKELKFDPQNSSVDIVCVIDTDDDNCLRYTIIVRRK